MHVYKLKGINEFPISGKITRLSGQVSISIFMVCLNARNACLTSLYVYLNPLRTNEEQLYYHVHIEIARRRGRKRNTGSVRKKHENELCVYAPDQNNDH